MNTLLIILLLAAVLPFLGFLLLTARPLIRIMIRFKTCKDDIRPVGNQMLKDVISLIENTLHAQLPEYEVIMVRVPEIDFGTFCIYGTILLKFKEKLPDEFIKLLEECNTAENKKKMKYDFINTQVIFNIYQDAATLRMRFSETRLDEKESDTPYIICYANREFNEMDRNRLEKMKKLDHYYKEPEQPDGSQLYGNVITWEELAKKMKLPQTPPSDNINNSQQTL